MAEDSRRAYVLYDDRGTLRSTESATGVPVVVQGLGLFVWVSGSDEPDDDETCFATENGRWLLEAPHWDLLAQAWMTEIQALTA